MEEITISVTAQISMDALKERINKFEILLNDQVNILGAGHIVAPLRKAIKKYNPSCILISNKNLYLLIKYNFVKPDSTYQNYFDKVKIYTSKYVVDTQFFLTDCFENELGLVK